MAKGTDRLEQQEQALAEQRAQWANDKTPVLRKAMLPATVRFLEQGPELHDYAVHEYQVFNQNNPSNPYRRNFTCLNDANNGTLCPGCQSGMKVKLKGVYNVIHRNRAILRKGADGKAMKDPAGNYITDGYEDAVVVFLVPSTTAGSIKKKDTAWKGIMSGEVAVTVSGDTFNPFNLEPADVSNWAVPMSEADQALAASKHNLDEYMKSPDFAEAARIAAQHATQQKNQQPAAPQVPMPAPGQQPAGVPAAAAAASGNAFLGGMAAPPPAQQQ